MGTDCLCVPRCTRDRKRAVAKNSGVLSIDQSDEAHAVVGWRICLTREFCIVIGFDHQGCLGDVGAQIGNGADGVVARSWAHQDIAHHDSNAIAHANLCKVTPLHQGQVIPLQDVAHHTTRDFGNVGAVIAFIGHARPSHAHHPWGDDSRDARRLNQSVVVGIGGACRRDGVRGDHRHRNGNTSTHHHTGGDKVTCLGQSETIVAYKGRR